MSTKSAVRSENIASYQRVVSRYQLQAAVWFKNSVLDVFQPTAPRLACSHSPDEFNAHKNLEKTRDDLVTDTHSDQLRDVTDFRLTLRFWWRQYRSGCGKFWEALPLAASGESAPPAPPITAEISQ